MEGWGIQKSGFALIERGQKGTRTILSGCGWKVEYMPWDWFFDGCIALVLEQSNAVVIFAISLENVWAYDMHIYTRGFDDSAVSSF